jgi:hypothetical protein
MLGCTSVILCEFPQITVAIWRQMVYHRQTGGTAAKQANDSRYAEAIDTGNDNPVTHTGIFKSW